MTPVYVGVGFLKGLNRMEAESVLLSTAYLPNLAYLSQVIKAGQIVLEKHEYFVKQTYRNRCDILSSSGKLSLSIPLVKQADKELITDKRISYAENWQQQHWRSITSAYKNSPYFEYFEDEFKPFYENRFEFLFDYNLKLLQTVLHILRTKKDIEFTTSYEINPTIADYRTLSDKHQYEAPVKPYYQVFSDKLAFTPNLSCLDVLFNEGLQTLQLLK